MVWGLGTLADNFTACIDLYIRQLFPVTPLVEERALRSVASRMQTESSCREDFCGESTPSSLEPFAVGHVGFSSPPNFQAPDAPNSLSTGSLAIERSLTLLSALCPTVTGLLPATMMSPGLKASADCLLQGSRQLLHAFQDLDIEQPCATSVVIRYFHSISAHAAGQPRLSWHLLGEAIRMAQDLQVYDEASLSGLSAHEGHLRRSLFWQLTTGDRSSAILNSRPFAFRQSNFVKPFSTGLLPLGYDCLLDQVGPYDARPLTTLVNTGFNVIALVFQRGAEILLTLRSLERSMDKASHAPDLVKAHKTTIAENLGGLHAILDDLPDWLQRPWTFATTDGRSWEELDHYSCYIWILYTNILLTYHCLQLILWKRASEIGQVETLGYSADANLQELHALRIIKDALQVVRSSPFEALQVNGEPSVRRWECHEPTCIGLADCKDRWRRSGRLVPFFWNSTKRHRMRMLPREAEGILTK